MLTEKFVRYIVREKIKKYLCFHSGKAEILPPRPQNKAPLMLYVHIPFCEKLCTYCSFHRVPFQEKIAREYFAALRREIKLYKQAGYDFQAAYIGGGTPTVLIDELAKTIGLIRQSFQVTEISVETNPNHLEPKRMKVLQEVGVDRLSVGIQSFDDTILKSIGRYEQYGSGEEIFAKIKTYRQWFKTINIDMIFNFPTQTAAMLQQDLDLIRQLGISQVTFYPLMIATTTKKNMEKTMGVVQPQRGKEFYEIIRKAMEQDYQASTALCFSKNDSMIDEYVVNYDEYVGIGSGAFGYVDGTVYANCFDIPQYIQQVNEKKFPIMAYRNFESRSTLLYDFMMEFFGQNVNLPQLRAKHGFWTTLYLYPILLFFWSIGAIKQVRSGSFTACKPYYGVIMMREFFTGVNNFRDFCRARANQSLTSSALLANRADKRQAI